MDKAEWDAVEPREKDSLIAKMLGRDPEVHTCAEETSEGIVPCWEGTDRADNCGHLLDGGTWETCQVKFGGDPISYTTDRNACALVLDEIERRGAGWRCFIEGLASQVLKRTSRKLVMTDCEVWKLLRANPDTICYCALKAVSDDADMLP